MANNNKIIRTSKPSVMEISPFTVYQKRGWALIVNELQQYIGMPIDWNSVTADTICQIIPLTQNSLYEVHIPCNQYSKEHPQEFFKELERLLHIVIRTEVDGCKTAFTFFNKVELKDGVATLSLPLNSLRWILDWGQKQMFTAFDKPSFLALSTSSSQNLFLLLSEHYNQKTFSISIEEFKQKLLISPSYDTANIVRKILNPAQKEFAKRNTLFNFTYELYYQQTETITRGRKGYNHIRFNLIPNTENV